MSRILVLMTLAAATLAAKDRVYQTGTLLDKSLNPYIRTTESGESGPKSNDFVNGTVTVAVNTNRTGGAVTYEDYVVEVDDTVYLIEVARMKTYKAPRLSLSRPVNVAVEKNKLYIKDLDNAEYVGDILKQVSKNGPKESGPKQGDQLAAVETKPAPAAKPVAPPAPKTQEVKPPAATVATKTPAKPDPFAVASAKVASQPPPAATVPPAAQPPAPKPAPKAEAPKVEAAVTKAPEKPATSGLSTPRETKPAPKPENVRQEQGVSRSTIKDRAWQSGQLLSIVNNNYFFNVTYSADTEGTSWPFTQGSDGRYTVNGQIANPTNSLYTYDNYVIESQFVVYLVQRMRPKTSPPVRLPGLQALKFAVEKNKLWTMDEQNIEYEMKIVKAVQKETIVDPLTRAAARN